MANYDANLQRTKLGIRVNKSQINYYKENHKSNVDMDYVQSLIR